MEKERKRKKLVNDSLIDKKMQIEYEKGNLTELYKRYIKEKYQKYKKRNLILLNILMKK